MNHGQFVLAAAAMLLIGGCHKGGPNSYESRQNMANMSEPVDQNPASAQPGAAPGTAFQPEPRHPAAR
jgi:hypothetical protein